MAYTYSKSDILHSAIETIAAIEQTRNATAKAVLARRHYRRFRRLKRILLRQPDTDITDAMVAAERAARDYSQ